MTGFTTASSGGIVVVAHHLAIEGFASLAVALSSANERQTHLLVLSNEDSDKAAGFGRLSGECESYERRFRSGELDGFSLEMLYERYPSVPWGTVVAAERSFTDYSFLFGGTGHRRERGDYIVPLVLRLVAFFDAEYDRYQPELVITAFGDNIFTLIATIVAEERGIRILLPQPAYLNEGAAPEAGYFGNSRYLESYAMIRHYLELRSRPLTEEERTRARVFAEALISYDGNATLAHIYKKKDFEKPVTPQRNRLQAYLREQHRLDPAVAFYKIDLMRKAIANVIRLIRHRWVARFLERQTKSLPPRTVFYPMHFQPEASTLVNGIWYANQIALIEKLSMALPLGYTLVVKEHPRGRGVRPPWQYEHLASLHNVQFCDLPSKQILRHSEMVVSISGSIGLEAMAMKKPVLMFGRTFHSFNSLYYRAGAPEALPEMFHRILIERDFYRNETLEEDIYRFLLAYIAPMYGYFPVGKQMAELTPLILYELEQPLQPSRSWLATLFPERTGYYEGDDVSVPPINFSNGRVAQ